MTYGHPPPQSGKSKISGFDLGWCIAVLAPLVLFDVFFGFIAVFSLIALDSCQQPYCSVAGTVSSVLITVLVLAAVALVGTIVTAVRLARRKRAWPIAVITFGVSAVTFGLGIAWYTAASGFSWS
jgi:hypothetical protein